MVSVFFDVQEMSASSSLGHVAGTTSPSRKRFGKNPGLEGFKTSTLETVSPKRPTHNERRMPPESGLQSHRRACLVFQGEENPEARRGPGQAVGWERRRTFLVPNLQGLAANAVQDA